MGEGARGVAMSERKLEGGERILIARALREQAKLGRQAATTTLARLNKPTDRPTPSDLALKLQTQVDNLNAEAQVCDRLATEIEQHTIIVRLGAIE